MRKVKKATALLAVTAMVITSFAGCGKSNNDAASTKTKDTSNDKKTVENISLKVWSPQDDQKEVGSYSEGVLKELCKKFDEAHPEWNIKFTFGICAEGDALKNLKKDPAAGADVFMYTTDQLAGLVEAGITNPLAPTAEATMNKTMDEQAVSAVKSGDKLYGFPYTANSWFLYYNKSMFSADEVKSLDTMMAKKFDKGVYNFAIDVDNAWYNSAFFFANGDKLFGDDGTDAKKCTFNDAKGVEAGNYLLDLYKTKKVFDITNNNEKKLFQQGKIAATCSGTWDAVTYKKALGENYAAAKLPTVKMGGKDLQLSNFKSYKVVGVNSQTKAPKAALALAEYLASDEAQQVRLDAQSIAPTSKAISGKLAKADPAVKAINEQLQYSTLQPSISQMNNFWTPAQALGAGIIDGSVTKDNMQAKLDKMVDGILKGIK
ncbi:maltose/maltodextrin ABC transporter, substrate binding periplasmic protein MalE [Lachnospiraceae bacterium KM106-2]|nr:maltose/maltodextrin ABC transporter, substrate binding periplasmic protein MalE [Lachnospiraceae bacterium KM106-2]